MPHRVGHGLRDDPVGRDLDDGGEPVEVAVDIDGHRGAALRPGRAGRAQRPHEPEVVKGRRPEALHEATHVVDGRAGLLAGGEGEVGRPRRVAPGDGGADDVEPHDDTGQLGAEAVVEVAAQAPALVLTGREQPAVRLLEVAGQPQRVRRGRQGPGERLEHAGVGVGQARRAGVPRRDQQLTDLPSVQVKGDAVRPAGQHARLLAHLTARGQRHDDADARQTQARLHELGSGGEGLARGVRLAQRPVEVSEQGVRVAAAAVEEPVDDALEANPRGVEGQGHGERGHKRHDALGGADQGADPPDEREVHQGRSGEQQPHDEGAVDEHIEVVEAVAQRRDGESGWDEEDDHVGPGGRRDEDGHDDERHGVPEPAHLAPLDPVGPHDAHDHRGQRDDDEQAHDEIEHRADRFQQVGEPRHGERVGDLGEEAERAGCDGEGQHPEREGGPSRPQRHPPPPARQRPALGDDLGQYGRDEQP